MELRPVLQDVALPHLSLPFKASANATSTRKPPLITDRFPSSLSQLLATVTRMTAGAVSGPEWTLRKHLLSE